MDVILASNIFLIVSHLLYRPCGHIMVFLEQSVMGGTSATCRKAGTGDREGRGLRWTSRRCSQSLVQVWNSTVMTTRIVGLTFALLAAVFAAAYDILIRFCCSGITPWHIILARAVFGLALSVAAARVLGLNLLGRNPGGMLLIALTLVAGVLCMIFALFHLPVFEAVLLLYLYPVFGALFSPLLVNERMGPRLWGLIALAFCGTAFILWPRNMEWSVNWGHLLGIGAGLTHGLALTLVRRYSRENSSLTPFFYFCAMGALVSVGALSLGSQTMEFSRTGLATLVCIAISACLAQLCMIKSATFISSAEVGIIGMSEIVFGGLLSFLFFGESVGPRQLMGGILVVSCGVALAFDTNRGTELRCNPVVSKIPRRNSPGRVRPREAPPQPASWRQG